MGSQTVLAEEKSRLLTEVIKNLSALPEGERKRFDLREKSSSGSFEGETLTFQMTLGRFQGESFFFYKARKNGFASVLKGAPLDGDREYWVWGFSEKVCLLGVFSPRGYERISSKLTIDNIDSELGLLRDLVSETRGVLDSASEAQQKLKTEMIYQERQNLPTPEISSEISNPYLKMGVFQFAFISTCVVIFLPWSLLICLLLIGFENTRLLVSALLHDIWKTLKIVLAAIVVLGSAIAYFVITVSSKGI